MQIELDILKRFSYSDSEWKITKLFTVAFWNISIWKITTEYNSQPFPEGICNLINCAFFSSKPIVYIILIFAALASICYYTGRYIIPSLLFITFCSITFLSLERSNGIYDRIELWSMVFAAQLFAAVRLYFAPGYFSKNSIKVQDISMFYSIQMIAVAYVVAGITKMQTAGLDWIIESPNILIQLKKIAYQIKIDFNFEGAVFYSEIIRRTYFKYDWVVQFSFFFAYLIELFAFICCFSKKHAFYYSFLILILHAGIAVVMFVVIPIYLFMVVFYLLNFSGYLEKLFSKCYNRVTIRS